MSSIDAHPARLQVRGSLIYGWWRGAAFFTAQRKSAASFEWILRRLDVDRADVELAIECPCGRGYFYPPDRRYYRCVGRTPSVVAVPCDP